METLNADETAAFDAAFRIKLRHEAGIDPREINIEMNELRRAMPAPERAAAVFSQPFLDEQLHDFLRDTEKAFSNFRDSVICRLVLQYQRCLPPNVSLHFSEFVYDMNDRIGRGGFDAGVVEDRVVEMLPETSEIAFRQLMSLALGMVYSGFVSDLVDENKLLLWVPLGMTREDAIEIIGKLSRIVLLGEDPATARDCKCKPIAFEPMIKSMEPGEPIIGVSDFEYSGRGFIRVEYWSPQDARRVAEVLVRSLVGGGWHETVRDQ